MTFGAKLRSLRLERGWSQGQLSKALGYSQTTISSWEVGTNEPDFETIQQIADFFHVSPQSMLPFEFSFDDETHALAQTIQKNPKLKVLFDRTAVMQDSDLDAVLSVVKAISRERDAGE